MQRDEREHKMLLRCLTEPHLKHNENENLFLVNYFFLKQWFLAMNLISFFNGVTFVWNMDLWDEQQLWICRLYPWRICQIIRCWESHMCHELIKSQSRVRGSTRALVLLASWARIIGSKCEEGVEKSNIFLWKQWVGVGRQLPHWKKQNRLITGRSLNAQRFGDEIL